jgi:hypothetical protein
MQSIANTMREQQIRECAYQLWLAEGRPEGRALDHWTRAAAMLGMTIELAPAVPRKPGPGSAKPARRKQIRKD